MIAKRQQGFTLVEAVVALGLLALILGGIGNIAWQLWVIPSRGEAHLSALSDLRNAEQRITEDANKSHYFWLGSPTTSYGYMFWVDYTLASPQVHTIHYYFQEGELWRQEKVEDTVVLDQSIARNIARFEDVKFTFCNGLLKVRIKSTVDAVPEPVPKEVTFYAKTRARARQWALFAGLTGGSQEKAIEWTGSDSEIAGDVHSNSDVFVSGSDNRFDGLVEARQGFQVSQRNNNMAEQIEEAPLLPLLPPPPLSNLEPYTFSWEGNVNLNTIAEVWEDYPQKKKLKPGVYFTTGRLTLPNNGVEGEVTFVAQHVRISGNNIKLTPHRQNVLFYGTGSGGWGVNLSGSDDDFTGVIYAPQGEADVTGARITVKGSVVAQKIHVSGSFRQFSYQCYE